MVHLQVVSVKLLCLLRLLLIGKSNGLPTVLSVWQYLGHDGDQNFILIIDGTFLARHPSNRTKKAGPVQSKGDRAKRQ